VDTRTKILGGDFKLPLFVSPAAMAKLIHSEGECAIARACESKGIMQGVSCRITLYNPEKLVMLIASVDL
jgi:L-lactate dehydrogenase (cytochrome)